MNVRGRRGFSSLAGSKEGSTEAFRCLVKLSTSKNIRFPNRKVRIYLRWVVHYHLHRRIAQCATDGFSILLNRWVGLLLGYKWSLRWCISELGCKSYSIAKAGGCILLDSPATAPSALSNLQEEVPHPNRTPPPTSPHSSMRHRRFFDIIESMCRPTIGLQMKPPLVYFRHWVQKLLNCKSWVSWKVAGPFRQPRRSPYLI